MKKNKKLYLIFGIILLVGLIFGAYYYTTSQTAIAFSTANVGTDGQVYWIWYGSASTPGDTYNWNFAPSTYLFQNGTQVKATKSASIQVNPEQPLCNYQLTQQTKNYGLFSKVTYYELNNPQKVANVNFKDINTGITKKIDTTTQNTVTFDANGGKLTIESQGLLGGQFNCPSYSNTVLVKFDNGQYAFYKQDQFDNYFQTNYLSLKDIIFQSLFKSPSNLDSAIGQDKTFTDTFKSYPLLSPDGSTVTGAINLGYGSFTITGNQKYFASTTYNPPQDAKPRISSISIPSQIQQNSQNSFIVYLTNSGQTGNVIVTTSSDVLSILPTSTNVLLSNTGTTPVVFNVVGSNIAQSGKINIQVCAVNQFQGNINCVSQSKSITITQAPAKTFCGDGICQANENNATCPADCNIITAGQTQPTQTGVCGAWIKLPKILGGKTILPDLFCLVNNLVKPIKWIIGLIAGFLGGLFAFKLGENEFKKKKDKWIPIALGLLIGGSIIALVIIYFWYGIIALGIFALIKWVLPKF